GSLWPLCVGVLCPLSGGTGLHPLFPGTPVRPPVVCRHLCPLSAGTGLLPVVRRQGPFTRCSPAPPPPSIARHREVSVPLVCRLTLGVSARRAVFQECIQGE